MCVCAVCCVLCVYVCMCVPLSLCVCVCVRACQCPCLRLRAASVNRRLPAGIERRVPYLLCIHHARCKNNNHTAPFVFLTRELEMQFQPHAVLPQLGNVLRRCHEDLPVGHNATDREARNVVAQHLEQIPNKHTPLPFSVVMELPAVHAFAIRQRVILRLYCCYLLSQRLGWRVCLRVSSSVRIGRVSRATARLSGSVGLCSSHVTGDTHTLPWSV